MRRFSLVIVGLAAVMLALSPITAAAATTQGISGWEIFPGVRSETTVYGATFAGWTDKVNTTAPIQWVPPLGTGGNWILSINYTGTPGAGRTVAVTGGWWSLRKGSTRYSGLVTPGSVTWSATSTCGTNNAVVRLGLLTFTGISGSVTGCLDDQHVFPPQVWGTVTL